MSVFVRKRERDVTDGVCVCVCVCVCAIFVKKILFHSHYSV